jgi:hypothetical protein
LIEVKSITLRLPQLGKVSKIAPDVHVALARLPARVWRYSTIYNRFNRAALEHVDECNYRSIETRPHCERSG